MNRGIAYAALAYAAWGLFPLYFRQLAGVGALEIVLHRVAWSLLFLVAILLGLRRWQWLAAVRQQPRVLGACALSALLLSCNWLIYVWAVMNGRVLDASLGYFSTRSSTCCSATSCCTSGRGLANGRPWR